MKTSKFLKLMLPFIYIGVSLPMFNKVYYTTKCVIDEEFHLRQGLHYCNKRFFEWDPKITTFPGLYIVSCLVIPLNLCNVYGLRLVSLLASAFNVYLIFKIRELKRNQISILTLAMESITIAILPPMYFFSHLYYTDVLSITFFLSMYYYWDIGSHNIAAIFAGFSVLVRQTNIVWVVLLLGTSFLEGLVDMYAYRNGIKNRSSVSLFSAKTVFNIISSWGIVLQSVVNTLRHLYGYVIVLVVFVSFVIANGSIVVGDKSAHEATLHIPQIFYFALFTLVFGAPLLFAKIKDNLLSIINSWKFYVVGSIIFAIVVDLNTLEHPYLLADNRHYTFYVWSRFYRRHKLFKFCIVPLYVLGLQFIQKTIGHLSNEFQIMFWITSFTALCGQKLLEVRYFLIPFMIVRLNYRTYHRSHILYEFTYNLIINALTFMIFFKKEIIWSNYTESQRLIW